MAKKLPELPYGQGGFDWLDEANGIMRYRLSYKANADGKTYRLSVTGKSARECFNLMDAKKRQKEKDASRLFRTSMDNKAVSLSNAMLNWLKNTKNSKNKATTYDRDECTIRNQIDGYPIGRTCACSVDADDIMKHIHYLQYEANNGAGYSFSTVKKTYELLDQFFRYYYRNNRSANPMNETERPERIKHVGEITLEEANASKEMYELVLSDDEIKVFREFCFRTPQNGVLGGTKYKLELYFIMLTFLRIGEAITLTWGDVDFDEKTLRVNKTASRVKNRDAKASAKTKVVLTKPKTETSSRLVALTDDAIDVLSEIRVRSRHTAKNDFIICTSTGNMVAPQNLYSGLRNALKACGLNKNGERDKFSLHYLRHTGISYYIRNGVPIEIVSEMAGHASTAITERTYYHIIKEQRKDALKIMNAIGGAK